MFLSAIAAACLTGQGTAPHELFDLSQLRIEDYRRIQTIRDGLSHADLKVDPMTAIMTTPEIRAMGLDNPAGQQIIDQALAYRFDRGVIAGCKPIEASSNGAVLNMSVPRFMDQGKANFRTLREALKAQKPGVYRVKATIMPLPVPGGPAPKPPEVHEAYLGVLFHDDLASYIKLAEDRPTPGVPVKIKATIVEDSLIPVEFYQTPKGEVVAVLTKEPPQPLVFPPEPTDFWLSKKTPDECKKAFDSNKLRPDQMPIFAVKTSAGIVDLEHFRRKCYLELQRLRDVERAKHPSTADFPPEMLQSPEFKSTGLDMSMRGDQLTLRDALAYKPEGQPLKGYHPVDFGKDKVAGMTAVTTKDATGNTVQTFKDMYEGKRLFVYKLRLEPAKPDAAHPNQQPAEAYYGPMTPETLAAVEKSKPDIKVTDLKDQDIPISIYTDGAGDVAFVLAFRPKDLLTLPQHPQVLVASDPVSVMKPLETPNRDEELKLVPTLHQLKVDFAFEK